MKKFIFLLTTLILGAATLTSAQDNPDAFEKKSKYSYEKTIELIKEAVIKAGWTNPNEHDMQASMKKSGKEVLPAKILVLCNADFAYQILQNEDTRILMSMMPCRVAVYEKSDGTTWVAWTNLLKKSQELGESLGAIFRKVATDMAQITEQVIE